MLVKAGVTVTVGVVFPGVVTMTEPVPVALLYPRKLAESGAYVAVNGSVPTGNDPAGMGTVTVPLLRVPPPKKVPPDRLTVPVGAGLPLPPLTTTNTETPSAVVMLDGVGVTVTIGVVIVAAVTVTEPVPVAVL